MIERHLRLKASSLNAEKLDLAARGELECQDIAWIGNRDF
jgi:hypothetical protein